MVSDPGGLAIGLTVLLLFSIGLVAFVLTAVSRRRQQKKENQDEEKQTQARRVRITSKPPQLPMFKTRSSLSMSSAPGSPKSPVTPKTPGIRFIITAPSCRSQRSGSIDSLPSVEAILEKYEQEMDAAEVPIEHKEKNRTASDAEIGEPGPSIPS